MFNLQKRVFILFWLMRTPFVQRLVVLIVSGLIALLLGCVFFFGGHSAGVIQAATASQAFSVTVVCSSERVYARELTGTDV
jgi:hypothetical protein